MIALSEFVNRINLGGQLAICVGLYAFALLVGVPCLAWILGRLE